MKEIKREKPRCCLCENKGSDKPYIIFFYEKVRYVVCRQCLENGNLDKMEVFNKYVEETGLERWKL